MKQPIELRRLRDFGQIINDTFTFLKQNFKPLFRALMVICSFFIVLGTITSVLTYMNMGTMFNTSINLNSYDAQANSINYILSVLFNALVMVLTQVLVHMVTLCYISVYLQKNNNKATLAEVWGYFKYYFWRVLGSGIVIFFMVCIGFLLCIIPGIYVANVSYLIIPIIIVENASFSFAFNKSFRLVKNNWWFLFGVAFVMGLIVSVAGSIANVPLTFIPLMSQFFAPLKAFSLPLMIIFSALRSILMLAYVLPAIAVCLCYFNFAEQKDSTGLLSRIENIGKSETENPTLPAEEY